MYYVHVFHLFCYSTILYCSHHLMNMTGEWQARLFLHHNQVIIKCDLFKIIIHEMFTKNGLTNSMKALSCKPQKWNPQCYSFPYQWEVLDFLDLQTLVTNIITISSWLEWPVCLVWLLLRELPERIDRHLFHTYITCKNKLNCMELIN